MPNASGPSFTSETKSDGDTISISISRSEESEDSRRSDCSPGAGVHWSRSNAPKIGTETEAETEEIHARMYIPHRKREKRRKARIKRKYGNTNFNPRFFSSLLFLHPLFSSPFCFLFSFFCFLCCYRCRY